MEYLQVTNSFACQGHLPKGITFPLYDVTSHSCSYRKTIVMRDQEQELAGLLSTEASDFIHARLEPFKSILKNLYPDSFIPTDSSNSSSKFKNIQLDIYNRFAESVCLCAIYDGVIS